MFLIFLFRFFAGVYVPGFPDVYFRLGAGFQPLDVFAVGVDQQDGDHERKDHEGDRIR